MSQHGSVQLRSGRWDWSVRPQHSGVAVVYQHRSRHGDELRTWAPDPDVTPDRAADLALQPIERRWVDPDGLSWTITVDLPSDWARPDRSDDERSLNLVFSIGSLVRKAQVPASCRVGELTHMELADLLREAR
ncbi:MAG: hypothetical protein WD766_06845 [Gemmatimonadota bacterium]